jgi:5-methylcytosine-specific restriction protein B
MNTADRSIALVDHALRRRFAFISLRPQYKVLERFHQGRNYDAKPLVEILQRLNEAIADSHYEIGISFFLEDDLASQLPEIWQMEIEPYLEEYFFDKEDQVKRFCWASVGAELGHSSVTIHLSPPMEPSQSSSSDEESPVEESG